MVSGCSASICYSSFAAVLMASSSFSSDTRGVNFAPSSPAKQAFLSLRFSLFLLLHLIMGFLPPLLPALILHPSFHLFISFYPPLRIPLCSGIEYQTSYFIETRPLQFFLGFEQKSWINAALACDILQEIHDLFIPREVWMILEKLFRSICCHFPKNYKLNFSCRHWKKELKERVPTSFHNSFWLSFCSSSVSQFNYALFANHTRVLLVWNIIK